MDPIRPPKVLVPVIVPVLNDVDIVIFIAVEPDIRRVAPISPPILFFPETVLVLEQFEIEMVVPEHIIDPNNPPHPSFIVVTLPALWQLVIVEFPESLHSNRPINPPTSALPEMLPLLEQLDTVDETEYPINPPTKFVAEMLLFFKLRFVISAE